MTAFRLFACSFLVTLIALLTIIYVQRARTSEARVISLTDQVYVTSQLNPFDLRRIRRMFEAVVDLRPDGEEPTQTSSAVMSAKAKAAGLAFHYLPIPHESIPDSSVEALREILDQHAQRIVLYCRSGRRAARTYALAEASRPGGMTAGSILEAVQTAGFSAEDLKGRIEKRISDREAAGEAESKAPMAEALQNVESAN